MSATVARASPPQPPGHGANAAGRSGWRRLFPGPIAGPLPLSPPHRRIYILPSRFGLVYGLALVALLVGALNYNNNPAILLAMLLAAAALCSSVLTVRHLARLSITGFHADDTLAGQPQRCRLELQPRSPSTRGLVSLRHGPVALTGTPDAQGRIVFEWAWPSVRRGWRPLGTIRLGSDYPLGLFHAWCELSPGVAAIVFPVAETPTPPWPDHAGAGTGASQQHANQDDWFQLREFQRGDGLNEIAWKVSARHDRWLVAETRAQTSAPTLRFSLDQVSHLEREHGISRLAAWLLAADAQQRPYALELAGHSITAGLGTEQRRQALTALAELP